MNTSKFHSQPPASALKYVSYQIFSELLIVDEMAMPSVRSLRAKSSVPTLRLSEPAVSVSAAPSKEQPTRRHAVGPKIRVTQVLTTEPKPFPERQEKSVVGTFILFKTASPYSTLKPFGHQQVPYRCSSPRSSGILSPRCPRLNSKSSKW